MEKCIVGIVMQTRGIKFNGIGMGKETKKRRRRRKKEKERRKRGGKEMKDEKEFKYKFELSEGQIVYADSEKELKEVLHPSVIIISKERIQK